MDISLSGRAAIVTGGTKGLGYAIATRFAASGADVVIAARGREALDKAVKEVQRRPRAASSACRRRCGARRHQRIYDEAVKAFGKVDIVVNNAGTSRNGAIRGRHRRRLARGYRPEGVRRHPHDAGRLAGMKERNWGRVINVLNIGSKAPRAGTAPTTISRAAGAR